MLKQNELQVLELLFDDLTSKYTIHSLSEKLNQKYPQTFRIVKELENKKLIILETIGNSKVISLDFENFHEEYIIVEISRTKKTNSKITKIIEILRKIENVPTSILFGSFANNTNKKDSDIDLLFLTENEKIQREIKNKLSLYNIDFNFISKENLLDLFFSKGLNLGQEILKNHKVLTGFENFIQLLNKKNG
ncbi:MAG: nucleotidyltransferase domain-containing protein [Nanoarchaeota archaeon]